MLNDSPKLLVVSEDDPFRSSLREQLENAGHQVLEASDVIRMLNVLNNPRVALIVTDLEVPKIDGLDLLTFLTQRLPQVPVIVISSSTTNCNSSEALNRGAFDFLTQPLQRDRLLTTIHQALLLHILREENELLREQLSETYLSGPHIDHPGGIQTESDHIHATQFPYHEESLPVDPGWLIARLLYTGISLAEVERLLIERALQLHDNNQTRAASALGLTRNTMIYRMKKHGIGRTS